MENTDIQEVTLTKNELDKMRADVVFQNYIMTCGRVFTGHEKRTLRRKIERDVKAGKYDKMFEDAANPKSTARGRSAFETLNGIADEKA